MKQRRGVKHAMGASQKCFEVTPSITSENASLECWTNTTFTINLATIDGLPGGLRGTTPPKFFIPFGKLCTSIFTQWQLLG